MRRHIYSRLILLALAAASSLSAAEITVKVGEVSGDAATVVINGNALPAVGDSAEIFFNVPAADEEISVGSGKVAAVEAKVVKITIEKTTVENAYSGLHQYEKAIADYDEAIRLDAKDAWAYNNRGVAYLETRRYKKAIEDFTQAIELDPPYAPAYLNRASAYEAMGKKQLARADLARARELQATGH